MPGSFATGVAATVALATSVFASGGDPGPPPIELTLLGNTWIAATAVVLLVRKDASNR